MFNCKIESFYSDLELSQAINDVFFIHHSEIHSKYLDLCMQYNVIEKNNPTQFKRFKMYLQNLFKEDLYYRAFVGVALINQDTKGKILYFLRHGDPFITFFKNDKFVLEAFSSTFNVVLQPKKP